MTSWLVTGGAGFIGSAFLRRLVRRAGDTVVCLDALTYAGNRDSVDALPGLRFVHGDIRDRALVSELLRAHRTDVVVNLAAESHVDRSIDGAMPFVDTNVAGTVALLEAATAHGRPLRFHHVSTDEVFGDLGPDDPPFTDRSPYRPSSPYAASKAAADHFVRAWGRTHGLAVVISNASNTYGPRQHPEKLIPVTILNALAGRPLPIYGRGTNVRDWLHVDDHAAALERVALEGEPGGTYLVGGGAERTNVEVVETVCRALDRRRPANAPHARLIEHVADRPGHDRRYAVDAARLGNELGWTPAHDFETGMEATVDWYLDNERWWAPVRDEAARRRGVAAEGA